MMLYSQKATREDEFVEAATAETVKSVNGDVVPKWAVGMQTGSFRMMFRLHQDAMQHGTYEFQLKRIWQKLPARWKLMALTLASSPVVTTIVQAVN